MTKYLVYIVFIILLSIESHAQDITTGLIAYWSFNDSTAKDQSGHGYDGTIQNSPTFVTGKDGAGIKLKGYGVNTTLGDHVLLPWIDFNSMTEFTVSMWVWEEGFAGTGGPSEGYIWWGDWNGGWLGIHHHCQQQPYIDFTKQYIRFSVGNKGVEAECFNAPFDSTDMFKWVNYVMTYKNGIINCYKNGNFLGGMNQLVSVAQGQGAIGRHWWNYFSETSSRLNAIIDEVKIYNRSLTPKDVKKLSEDCKGLIACWNFEDSTAKDVSGNGYDGKMMYNPTPVIGHNGKGTALHFTGNGVNDSTGSHILLPMIDFNNYSEFSLSMWVKCEGFTTPHGDAYIFFGDWDKGWLGITNHYNHINPPDKTWINFAVGSHLHDNQITVDYNPATDNNKWFYYCMTHNNGYTKAYINGVLVGEKAQTVDIYGNYAAIARSWWIDGDVTSTRFTGSIDDVKIFCTELSDSDVVKDYREISITSRTLTICDGDTLTLFATPGFLSYHWSTGESTDKIQITKTGIYTVKAYYLGAEYSDEYNVVALAPLKPEIKVVSLPCTGKSGELTVTGNYSKISWSTGDTVNTIHPVQNGLYFVNVTDTSGCTGYAEIQIDEIVPDLLKVKIIGSLNGCSSDTVTLHPVDDLNTYDWYDTALNQSPISHERDLKVTKPGQYYLIGRNKDSCITSSGIIDVLADSSKSRVSVQGISNDGKIHFDTVNAGNIIYKNLTLLNESLTTLTINEAYFRKNIEFSVPQSQLSININPMSEANLLIACRPNSTGVIADTLVLRELCGDTTFPALIIAKQNIYEASSGCEVNLKLTTDKKSVMGSYILGSPYPNPTPGILEIPYEKSTATDDEQPLQITITDLLTSEPVSYEIRDKYTDENSKQETGIIEIDLKKYTSGNYFLKYSKNGLNFAITLIEVRK